MGEELNKRFARAKKAAGNLNNEEVALMFGLAKGSFDTSSARDRYRLAFCAIVEATLEATAKRILSLGGEEFQTGLLEKVVNSLSDKS